MEPRAGAFVFQDVGQSLDGWPSGLRRTPGKRVCVKAYREFESHSIRSRFVMFARGATVQITGRPSLRVLARVSVLRVGCRYWVFHGCDRRRPGSLTDYEIADAPERGPRFFAMHGRIPIARWHADHQQGEPLTPC